MEASLYYVENMEHGWSWVEAASEEEAARSAAGEDCTVEFERVTTSGYPVHWFHVYDGDRQHIDDFMVTSERFLPGVEDRESTTKDIGPAVAYSA